MEDCSFSIWSENHQATINEEGSPIFEVPFWPDPPASNGPSSCQFHDFPATLPPQPMVAFEEDRATTASKSHSQSEKRRRDRINAQLATLRKLIPKSDKMDKAALLGSAVEHVKELKLRTLEVGKLISIPSDIDEVTLLDDCNYEQQLHNNSNNGTMFIRVSICCDDRPELFSEINHAMEGLRLRIIEADMTCLGGRIKCTFVVCTNGGDHNNYSNNGVGGMNNLKQALKVVLSRIVASSKSSNYRLKSKRQRFFSPSHYN